MALKELLVATIFIFVLAVFLVIAAPTIDGVADATEDSEIVGEEEPYDTSGKIQTVKFLSLVGVPTIAGLGFVIWAYTAIARQESYKGRL